MKTLGKLFKLIISALLFVIAYVALELVKWVLIICAVLIILVFNRDSFSTRVDRLARYFYICAYSYDQTGNAVGFPFFNVTMKKPEGYQFGNPDQPISYAIAKNWQAGTLTAFGKFWADFLNGVDYGAVKRGSNHMLESIEHTENGRG